MSLTFHQIVFEGVRGFWTGGDIAIDDIDMSKQACSQPGHCDFEDDMCTWFNIPTSVSWLHFVVKIIIIKY